MNFIRDMTEIEIKVLNAIKNGASFDLPIQARELRQDLGLSKRKLEEIIESLRVTFRQPIVTKKNKPNGYYMPRNKEERDAGLAPYRAQIRTEQKNLAAVMSVNLDEYWSNAKKPDGNQAQI
ncbi:putative DNA-binding phage protein [Streptococcus suis]|uniref:hypothetical protein n=1 Tax=Streptococcus suis TaxID=1307 RepID=UPI0005D2A87A|nr:hypothetical protein [Streptococcus suis]CYY87485.1 putative DNA-binding phage protein [Streptococcus suis]